MFLHHGAAAPHACCAWAVVPAVLTSDKGAGTVAPKLPEVGVSFDTNSNPFRFFMAPIEQRSLAVQPKVSQQEVSTGLSWQYESI